MRRKFPERTRHRHSHSMSDISESTMIIKMNHQCNIRNIEHFMHWHRTWFMGCSPSQHASFNWKFRIRSSTNSKIKNFTLITWYPKWDQTTPRYTATWVVRFYLCLYYPIADPTDPTDPPIWWHSGTVFTAVANSVSSVERPVVSSTSMALRW